MVDVLTLMQPFQTLQWCDGLFIARLWHIVLFWSKKHTLENRVYQLDHFASFSKSNLDTTTYLNFQDSISDPLVELFVLAVTESANSASFGELSRFGQSAGVHSVQGSEVAAIPHASWQARQCWRNSWESETYLWVILETFRQSVGSSPALIAKLPHSFWYLDLPPLVCLEIINKRAVKIKWANLFVFMLVRC